jgi:hypothetical protein
MEFLKSGKRLPVEVSSRYLNFKTKAIRFLSANDAELRSFLEAKLFWLSHRAEQRNVRVLIAEPYDVQYLGCAPEKLMAAAKELASSGLCKVDAEFATASDKIGDLAERMKEQLQKTLERAVAKFNQALIG